MKSNKILRLLILGFVMWLVPFLVSFGFFDRSGKVNINYDLFKSIMIVVSSLVGGYALIRHFRTINGNFLREAWLAGMVWLVLNLVLDLIILIPIAKMSYAEYFNSIGVRYLQIPVICIAAGTLLERKRIVAN
jgi:hypothetical protein